MWELYAKTVVKAQETQIYMNLRYVFIKYVFHTFKI